MTLRLSNDSIVINIGTSAQLAVVIPPDISSDLEYRPYLTGQSMALVATLTGGNSVEALILMLEKWLSELQLPVALTREELYHRVIASAVNKSDTTLQISPIFQGERHDPSLKGSIQQMSLSNWSLGDIGAATVKGIVDNIFDRLPRNFFHRLKIQRCICTGTAVQRNSLFKSYIAQRSGLDVEILSESLTAAGAAFFQSK